jgi:hypothetical protein
MINARLLTIPLVCVALSGSLLNAQDFSKYRGLQFGMNISAAAKHLGAKATEMRISHKRPDLIQEMDWEPRSLALADPVSSDPVKEALLGFFNGELFRIIVTYDRSKIEGMTADDMVEAISLTYGAATRPKTEIAYHSNYAEVAPVIARWTRAEYSYDLVRTGDQASFAMVLYSTRLDALAQASIIQAVRIEAQDAPRLELEKEKKRENEERLLTEKARSINRPNFRP